MILFDSVYSSTENINQILDSSDTKHYDSTYSIVRNIYTILGGVESNFDSTYSICSKILDLLNTTPVLSKNTLDDIYEELTGEEPTTTDVEELLQEISDEITLLKTPATNEEIMSLFD